MKGAPSFASCSKKDAHAAALSQKQLQLLHASAKGKFRTKGRYAAATVRGTNQRYDIGQVLAARVDPRDPSNLSVARGDPSLVPFIAPAVGAVLVLVCAGAWAYRRGRVGRAGRRAATSASS